MGLDQLIARLEREAQARADAALDQARAEAASIERQLALDSSHERAAALAELREKRRGRLERELQALRLKLRAAELEARQRALDRIFTRARALCPVAVNPAQLEQALRYLPGAQVRARCAPEAAAALKGLDVTVDASAGVRLEAADGSCTIELGAATALERRRAELSIALAKELRP